MMCKWKTIAVLPLLMAGSAGMASVDGRVSPSTYIVRKGDTLYGISQRYLVDASRFRALQQQNHVRQPQRLRIGARLLVADNLLRRAPLQARVIGYSGSVTAVRGGAPIAIAVGALLPEGSSLSTGANSFVTIGYADGSRMALPSLSHAILTRSSRVLIDNRPDRLLDLDSGRVKLNVAPLHSSNERFAVRTPVAVAAVRGTEFRVSFDPKDQTASIGVLSGTVWTNGLAVAPRQGTAIAGEGAKPFPRTLLPPPELADPDRPQQGEQVRFTIAEKSPGESYRFQLAHDAGFISLFAETLADGRQASFADVNDGTIFVRATAIDKDGVEGLPSIYAVDRYRNSLKGSVSHGPKQRDYLFRWKADAAGELRYHFELARDPALRDHVVDEAELTTDSMTINDLPHGTYYWRIQVVQRIDGKLFDQSLPATKLVVTGSR